MHETTIPRQLTIEEAAEVARRTPKAMRQLRERDRVRRADGKAPVGPPFRRIAGRILVDEDALARWLAGDPDAA